MSGTKQTTRQLFSRSILSAGIVMALSVSTANADVITLGFEEFGVVDESEEIGDFYTGGTNEAGVTGPDYGMTFSDNALALTSRTTDEPEAEGNFENNPVDDNIMFFLGGDAATLNVEGGFETGFSFYYSSSEEAFVDVYSEPGGEGELLESLELSANWRDNDCVTDVSIPYCNFDPVGVNFDGVAQSVDFGGTINRVGYDAITLGTDRPGESTPVDPTPVPAPATLALFLVGMGGLALRGVRSRIRKS